MQDENGKESRVFEDDLGSAMINFKAGGMDYDEMIVDSDGRQVAKIGKFILNGNEILGMIVPGRPYQWSSMMVRVIFAADGEPCGPYDEGAVAVPVEGRNEGAIWCHKVSFIGRTTRGNNEYGLGYAGGWASGVLIPHSVQKKWKSILSSRGDGDEKNPPLPENEFKWLDDKPVKGTKNADGKVEWIGCVTKDGKTVPLMWNAGSWREAVRTEEGWKRVPSGLAVKGDQPTGGLDHEIWNIESRQGKHMVSKGFWEDGKFVPAKETGFPDRFYREGDRWSMVSLSTPRESLSDDIETVVLMEPVETISRIVVPTYDESALKRIDRAAVSLIPFERKDALSFSLVPDDETDSVISEKYLRDLKSKNVRKKGGAEGAWERFSFFIDPEPRLEFAYGGRRAVMLVNDGVPVWKAENLTGGDFHEACAALGNRSLGEFDSEKSKTLDSFISAVSEIFPDLSKPLLKRESFVKGRKFFPNGGNPVAAMTDFEDEGRRVWLFDETGACAVSGDGVRWRLLGTKTNPVPMRDLGGFIPPFRIGSDAEEFINWMNVNDMGGKGINPMGLVKMTDGMKTFKASGNDGYPFAKIVKGNDGETVVSLTDDELDAYALYADYYDETPTWKRRGRGGRLSRMDNPPRVFSDKDDADYFVKWMMGILPDIPSGSDIADAEKYMIPPKDAK